MTISNLTKEEIIPVFLNFGKLPSILVSFDRFWSVFGRFRQFLAGFGQFLADFGQFLAGFGKILPALISFGRFWSFLAIFFFKKFTLENQVDRLALDKEDEFHSL